MAKKVVEPLRAAAEHVRDKSIPNGVAKLEVPTGDGERVDFFRGKDLVRYIEKNPGKFDHALKERTVERSPQDVAAELVRGWLARGLAMRAERKYTRPKPGRTRLVKWPRTLVPIKDQVWDEKSFYAWLYERPTSIWYYVALALLPVVVVGACLFPLAPWWARMALVYFLMAVLVALLGTMTVRYIIFAAVWITTGHAFWLFPNMMEDQASVVDAFRPVYTFNKAKSITENWLARIVTLAACGSLVWVLASHSPEMSELKEEVRHAHDSLFEYLDQMYGKNKSYLTDLTNSTTNSSAGFETERTGGQ